MASLIFLFVGALCLIVTVIVALTKNVGVLKLAVKRKPDEADEDYIKRGLKLSLIFSVVFLACGLLTFFRF